jgi:hypothetical protein
MRIQEIDKFLLSKGIDPDTFDDSAPYEVLRMIGGFNSDPELYQAIVRHFSEPEYKPQDAYALMNAFDASLNMFLEMERFADLESAKPAFALLDVIFSWEAWLSFAGEPQEFGIHPVFSQFDEKLFKLANASRHLDNQSLIEDLSEARHAATLISSVLPGLSKKWLSKNFAQNPYLLSNNPDLPESSVVEGIELGLNSLLFHPNAPKKLSKSRVIEILDEDPDELFAVLVGWQSIVENGVLLISGWPNWKDHKDLFAIIDAWLEENDDDLEVADFIPR